MSERELSAAGVTDPALRAAYRRCRELNAVHGRTYFLATRLLTAARRPAVHALYGFARWMDDIVDEPAPDATLESTTAVLDEGQRLLRIGLNGGHCAHPVIAALAHTARRYRIPANLFEAFLRSMRMDLHLRGYPTRTDLGTYVHGSARVIGLQLLPVLGTVTDPAEAAPHAAALGEAFQLTNFIRDVAEDLDRGRVYLPADELAAFGVDGDRLRFCRTVGRADKAVRAAVAAQIATTRGVYRYAAAGVPMLHPTSRPCVRAATTLYGRILDQVEAMDNDVFAGRARVGRATRARVAGAAFARALWARGTAGREVAPVISHQRWALGGSGRGDDQGSAQCG